MTPDELLRQLLNGIVEKRVPSTELSDEYQTADGPHFLKYLANYIDEHSNIKFCECEECPDSNRGNVIEGLMKTALELEMLKDSYEELQEMYDGLLGDWLEERNSE